MNEVIIISAISCISLIALVLIKPNININGRAYSIYWLAPLFGAIVLIVFECIDPLMVINSLVSSGEFNPIKILILFLSMTIISVFLDSVGFFRRLASTVLLKAHTSQIALFVYLYIMVSVLTVFTSNDIIVLTFTPFICYFARSAGISAIPYLVCEFIAANIWSMALIIGNPTNIYIAANAGITFAKYFSVMLLPTLLAGIVSFIVLYLLFKRQLKAPMQVNIDECQITVKPLVKIGLIHLTLCIILLCVASYINLPMWLISFFFCMSLLITAAIYLIVHRRGMRILFEVIKRAPWDVVPFVISMFIIVLTIEKCGISQKLSDILSGQNAVAAFGISSFVTANIVNNIPMSVLFSSVTNGISGSQQVAAQFASIIGSNLGAFLTPIGALAGIMWMGMLKDHGVKLSFIKFAEYGAAVSIPALAAALVGLIIRLN
ncbi:MAG: hypothetical protein J1E60_07445 [Christensenellaceae bacterium]|nr:hypothetical protein [Christensenellaceae bacterium]